MAAELPQIIAQLAQLLQQVQQQQNQMGQQFVQALGEVAQGRRTPPGGLPATKKLDCKGRVLPRLDAAVPFDD